MWKIIVTMLDGRSGEIDVSPMDTVGTLKQRIQTKMGVLVQHQRLLFENSARMDLSDDTRTINTYGMQSGSHVNLLVIPTPVVETFEVFLRNDKGKTTTYKVNCTETMGNFKMRVQSLERVPIDQMYLSYEGRSMSDDRLTLKDYGVQQHGTITMTLGLRGD